MRPCPLIYIQIISSAFLLKLIISLASATIIFFYVDRDSVDSDTRLDFARKSEIEHHAMIVEYVS